MSRVPFIVTIDTEGDDLWARPRKITTRNAEFLPRFQALCERFEFRPVYLTNYEMAMSDVFCEFAADVIAREAGEIGMHLHAWNSPPLDPLTNDDLACHPYLIEYPEAVMRDKVAFLTDLLEERFERKIVSHRAGRWALDGRYASILLERGYRVDCSVAPGFDWSRNPGAAGGGTDYRAFPRRPYLLDPGDIARAGTGGGLLEVPLTIRPSRLFRRAPWLYTVPLARRGANYLSPGLGWLAPIQPMLRASLQRHLSTMLSIARTAREEAAQQHLEFCVHSSELMPGGSPDFRTAADVELLYEHLEMLFDELSEWCRGLTLAEFRAEFAPPRPVRAPGPEAAGTGAPKVAAALDPLGEAADTPAPHGY